jgi:hypothetical protein
MKPLRACNIYETPTPTHRHTQCRLFLVSLSKKKLIAEIAFFATQNISVFIAVCVMKKMSIAETTFVAIQNILMATNKTEVYANLCHCRTS